MRTNHGPGPVNTNWGDKVGMYKLRPGRAGKYKFGARAGKYKFGARVGEYKLGTRAGKYKFGARTGKYKFGARAESQEIQIPIIFFFF